MIFNIITQILRIGLIILGVAVGSNAYMRHRLSVKLDEMKVLTQKIEEFALVSVSDPTIRKDSKGYLRHKVYNYRQDASILLRVCVGSKINSMLRTTPTRITEDYAEEFSTLLYNSFQRYRIFLVSYRGKLKTYQLA